MRDGWREAPSPTRLAPDHPAFAEIQRRHAAACASGLSTYLDPGTGFTVLTADYVADRGYCCSQGCRHCPWESAAT